MPKNWTGNVQVQLGGFFWVFLTVAVLSFIGWRCGWFTGGKLANMFAYSITGNRDLALTKSISEN